MLTTNEAIERLKGPALAEIQLIHQRPISNDGAATDTFYKGRIGLNDPLAYYERELLHAIDKIAPASAYHEIGGGIGLIPITLGLTGRMAVNIESARSRIDHGTNILQTLARDDPSLRQRVQMVCATAPEAFAKLNTTDAYAISTNVGGTRSLEFVVSFLKAVRERYTAFIFYLCLLFGVYREPEEWQPQLDFVSSVWGDTEPDLLFETSGPARYYIAKFKKAAVANR